MSEDVRKKVFVEMEVKGFKELADIQEEINKTQDEIRVSNKKGADESGKLTRAQVEQQKIYVKELRKRGREVEKTLSTEKTSLNGLRSELSKNIRELGNMKNVGSKAWQEQAARVKELRDQVAGAEAQYGTFSRNVGNYSGAIQDSFGRMGGSIGQVTGQMGQLTRMFSGAGGIATGAFGAAAAAIAGYLKLWQGYMQGTAERQLELNTTTGYYKQLWQDMLKEFDKFQDRRREAMREAGQATFMEKVGYLGQLLLGKEGAKEVDEYMQKVEKFRRDTNDALIREAKNRLAYEELMVKAYDNVKYSAEERLEFAEKAEVMLDAQAERRLELRRREFLLYRQEVEMSRSRGPEEEARLSQLAAAVYEAEAEFEKRKIRGLRRQNAALKELEKEEEARKKVLEAQAAAMEKQVAAVEKLLAKELSKFKDKDVKLDDADIQIEAITPFIQQIDARVLAERNAAKAAAEAWKESYAAQLDALEQARAAFLVTDEQYLARKQQLDQSATDNYIGQLKQAFGANVKMQQAVAIFEQAIAVKRALANVRIAIAEGTANTAKIGFPQNIIPLALFAGQVAGLIAQIKSFGKSNVVAAKGFSEGGYTGHGGKYEAAGIVHKGEVVWSQRDVAMMGGAALVDSLRPTRQLRGYAEGGIVGADPRTQFGNMRDMIREMVASVTEIPVVNSIQDISLKQDQLRKIKNRGDL